MEQLDKARAAAEAGDHRALRAVKPINYIVITDGASSTLVTLECNSHLYL